MRRKLNKPKHLPYLGFNWHHQSAYWLDGRSHYNYLPILWSTVDKRWKRKHGGKFEYPALIISAARANGALEWQKHEQALRNGTGGQHGAS